MNGHVVRITRLSHRMSQVDLAERLGISDSYLSMIENGERPITKEFDKKFREIFATDLNDIDALRLLEKALAWYDRK